MRRVLTASPGYYASATQQIVRDHAWDPDYAIALSTSAWGSENALSMSFPRGFQPLTPPPAKTKEAVVTARLVRVTARLVMVPRAGVEPTRPYGQRILSPLKSVLPSLTKRDEPYLPDSQPSKSGFVRFALTTEGRQLRVIFGLFTSDRIGLNGEDQGLQISWSLAQPFPESHSSFELSAICLTFGSVQAGGRLRGVNSAVMEVSSSAEGDCTRTRWVSVLSSPVNLQLHDSRPSPVRQGDIQELELQGLRPTF
jgi:hypothetical protein